MKPLSTAISNSKKSSIRKLFDLVLKAKNAISFGIGQPDFGPPEFVNDAIIDAIKGGKSQYAPTLGLAQLRESIAEMFRTRNRMEWVTSENVMVTNGGSHALQLSFATLTNPGDEIIISSPNFISYYYLASFYGLKCIEIPRKDNFSPDLDLIEEKIGDKTKFIIINTPNNPTGYVYTPKEIEKLSDLIINNDLYLISDEVYQYFLYDDATHISPASIKGMGERTITIDALSKTFGAPGYRVGFVSAPARIIELMEKYAQYTAAGVAHPMQYGAIAALQNGNPELADKIKEYKKKRDYCITRLNELNFKVNIPKGAFYIMPDVSNFGLNGDEFARRLMESKEVAVVPGSGFGSYSDTYIRISYATSQDKLEEGFNRMEKFLKENKLI